MQMQIIIEKFLTDEKSESYNLNVSDRMIMVIFASMMGNKNICWPGYELLSKYTGIGSFSTITKSIKKLEELKILFINREYKKNNRYSFTKEFIESGLQICNRVLQICNPSTTDMYANNIKNNKNNNRLSADKNKIKIIQPKGYNGLAPTALNPSPLLLERMNTRRK